MQAIMETLFDIVYLSFGHHHRHFDDPGQSGEIDQFRLFGWMAVILGGGRRLSSGAAGGGPLHHRARKLYGGASGSGQVPSHPSP